ncbi:copper resistance protein NlpE N-terminal domain-containing protein [Xanthomarina sp. F2636L]|uniref:copper resistance protein NlpE N-terminal domain-containing protein n=1 Tax=Xanthomarina sp. F2636L TaxID=2996018 RepID=UPI00225DD584|nr:copper resistance protein NlpE N-terminal domain-containing protein [Xanthomarina sp. F2636L]MCX7551507.1 copper resistance protein NlpE N-terminal domain-containing protein [Xanthomarina sp. F2636L]
MKNRLLGICVFALLLITSCNSNNKKQQEVEAETTKQNDELVDMHTSENALDWEGTYTGTLPCADCEGIEKTIKLNNDQTYVARDIYLGKKDGDFDSRGYFKWLEDGQTILLSDENETSFFVGENTLTQLDKSGNKVTGELADFYILKKLQNNSTNTSEFTDTKWKLVKLMGKDITDSEAFISFATDENRVFGDAGCNTFTGSFKIENGSQLELSNVATTMKACPDMTVESQFMEVLNTADNFSLNGNTMTLNKAKMAPLAVFEAEE